MGNYINALLLALTGSHPLRPPTVHALLHACRTTARCPGSPSCPDASPPPAAPSTRLWWSRGPSTCRWGPLLHMQAGALTPHAGGGLQSRALPLPRPFLCLSTRAARFAVCPCLPCRSYPSRWMHGTPLGCMPPWLIRASTQTASNSASTR